MTYARYHCPHCQALQDPMLHNHRSGCGGVVEWRGQALYCRRCGTRMSVFVCDHCKRRAEPHQCVT